MNLWPISEHLQKKSAQKLNPDKYDGLSKSATVVHLHGNCGSLGNFDRFFQKTVKK